MRYAKIICIVLVLTPAVFRLEAQEYNSVPLDHEAYAIIAMGITRGMIAAPPSAKPWPLQLIKETLWKMIDDPGERLSIREEHIVIDTINAFERQAGFHGGMYRTEGGAVTFEAGFGWESRFSVNASGTAFSDTPLLSENMARLYAGGNFADFASWNLSARGGLLYAARDEQGIVSAAFPYTFSRQWDGGVVSLTEPESRAAWPDDPALAGSLEGELNGVFFNRHLYLRLGRIRRDWGAGTNGTSLVMNSIGRPFTALEGTVSPLPWLYISFLGGALEYDGDYRSSDTDALFSAAFTAEQIEINLSNFFHFGIGGAMVVRDRPNAAAFANLELRLPGLFTVWGSLFIDSLHESSENFLSISKNSYAYQAGVRAAVRWLPLSSFTLRYSKVEPYCYSGDWSPPASAYVSGGEGLGYYLPPNSDELLLRFDTMLFPAFRLHVQYQLTRHGADYGYGEVGGSSLDSSPDNAAYTKFFLMDGVYRWNDVIKLGGSFRLKAGVVPLSVSTEAGLVITRFTINGTAGSGNEADYESLDDHVYPAAAGFIFSIGLKIFS